MESDREGPGAESSGYFQRKGVDKSLLSINDLYNAETDWIEIRFAEVLMNYGECANELGKTNEALDVLYKIRARAGIEAVQAATASPLQIPLTSARFTSTSASLNLLTKASASTTSAAGRNMTI